MAITPEHHSGKHSSDQQSIQQIIDSEARLKSIVTHTPFFIMEVGPDCRIRFINHALPPDTPESVIGREIFEWIPEDGHQKARDTIRTVIQNGEPGWYQTEADLPDGTQAVYSTYVTPVSNDGCVETALLIATDITEETKKQAKLETQHEILRQLSQGETLENVLTSIVKLIENEHPEIRCSVLLLDKDRQKLLHGAAPSLPDEYNALVNGIQIGPAVGSCGTAAYRNEPVVVRDTYSDSLWESFADAARSFGLRACWSFPIRAQDQQPIGTFAAYAGENRGPTADEMATLEQSSHIAGIAIAAHQIQEERRYQDELLKSMADSMPGLFSYVDAKGVYRFNSSSYSEWFQIPVEQMTGKTVAQAVGEGFYKTIAPFVDRATNGETVTFEKELNFQEDPRHVRATFAPRLDSDGNVDGYFGMASDITEQKQVEQSLRDQLAFEQLFSKLATDFINLDVSALDDATVRALHAVAEFLDVQRGLLFRFNAADVSMSCTHEWCSATTEPAIDRLQGIDHEHSPWIMAHYESGDVVVVEDVAALCDEAENERLQLSASGVKSTIAIPLMSSGQLIGVVAFDSLATRRSWSKKIVERLSHVGQMFTSALQRKESVVALRSKERQFQTLFDSSSDAIYVEDQTGKILDANTAACELHGCTREQLIGSHVLQWIPREHREKAWSDFQEMVDGHLTSLEGYCDGGIRGVVPVDLRCSCIDYHGQPALLLHVRDVSDRQRASQQLREHETLLAHASRLTTMGELAAELAHEINQPLFTISNYAETCRMTLAKTSEKANDELSTWLDQISTEANRAGDIIRHVLDYTRKQPTDHEVVDLNQVVRETATLLEFEIRQRDVQCQFSLLEDLPCVIGDRLLLQQVVVNFIRNGLDAIVAKGDATSEQLIQVSTEFIDGQVVLRVTDSGIGFDESSKTKMMDPFFTTKEDGLGLGLSICRSTIQSHGGVMLGYSDGVTGATFGFQLPAAEGTSVEISASSDTD